MLETIRDKEGNIQACLEWYLVDQDGNFDNKGLFVWVNQVEITTNSNGHSLGYIKEFTKRICKKVPWAKFGYFDREKYNRRIRMYSRNRWRKFAKEDNDVIPE